ncbi:hypothetical protein Dimus_021054 [Dionaea muscipula]
MNVYSLYEIGHIVHFYEMEPASTLLLKGFRKPCHNQKTSHFMQDTEEPAKLAQLTFKSYGAPVPLKTDCNLHPSFWPSDSCNSKLPLLNSRPDLLEVAENQYEKDIIGIHHATRGYSDYYTMLVLCGLFKFLYL